MGRKAFRKVNQAGIDLIKSFENLELETYPDVAGVLTIGYGHTGAAAKPGAVITEAKAEKLLQADLREAIAGVERVLGDTPAGDNEFAAFVSFTFNLGAGALARSTLMKRHRAGDYDGAAEAFLMWNKARDAETGKLRAYRGLTRRRKEEAALYLKAAWKGRELSPENAARMAANENREARGLDVVEASANRRSSLLGSRTMSGASLGAAGSVVTGLVNSADTIEQVAPAAQTALAVVRDYQTEILIVAGIAAVIGCGLALYARYSDHKAGLR